MKTAYAMEYRKRGTHRWHKCKGPLYQEEPGITYRVILSLARRHMGQKYQFRIQKEAA